MRGWGCIALALISGVLAGGCRTATRVKEVPRVDLELSDTGGNRGYLLGKAPTPESQKTTRQMVETDVEIPSLYRPKPSRRPVSLETEPAAPEAAEPRRARHGRMDTYVTQKGDSLWTIAAKPEIYGKASSWRRLYDANRDQLKTPDSVRPGMTLKVPRGKASDGDADMDEGTTYHK